MTNTASEQLSIALLDLLYALETADESSINEDFGISLMELAGAHLRDGSSDAKRELFELFEQAGARSGTPEQRAFFVSAFDALGIDG